MMIGHTKTNWVSQTKMDLIKLMSQVQNQIQMKQMNMI